MKAFIRPLLIFILAIFAVSCNSYVPYAYDDAYYKPGNDPVQQVKKDPREDFNKTDKITYDNSYNNRYNDANNQSPTPSSYYSQNRYTQAEQSENQQSESNLSNSNGINSNQNSSFSSGLTNEEEYYDPAYAQTVININSPVRSFNSFDPYVRDRILYTRDPFFINPTIYGGYTFWDPFAFNRGLNVGWNSWSGWNIGFGIGWGWNNWNNNWAWNTGFCPPYYDPFNPWSRWNAWNPYSGIGYGYSPYVNNYWNGYYHGFYDGNVSNNVVSNRTVNGRRTINTPRGNSGSINYNRAGTNIVRPTSSPSRNKSNIGTRPDNRGTISKERISNNSRPTKNETEQKRVNNTPQRYRSSTNPATYSREQRESVPNTNSRNSIQKNENGRPQNIMPNNSQQRPQQTRPQQSRPQQSRPNYSRPQRDNQYNNSRPKQQATPYSRPQQSTRPSRNFNNSRPSYTPRSTSPSRSVSPSRTTPSRSSNSRPSRR